MSEEVLNVDLGGGKAGEAVTNSPKVFIFTSPARTVSVHNGGANTVYAACGAVTAGGLSALITAGNALPIPAGRFFTFEATYHRLRGLAVACGAAETSEVTFGAF